MRGRERQAGTVSQVSRLRACGARGALRTRADLWLAGTRVGRRARAKRARLRAVVPIGP